MQQRDVEKERKEKARGRKDKIHSRRKRIKPAHVKQKGPSRGDVYPFCLH